MIPRCVASSVVQNNFGALLQWTEAHGDDLTVARQGEPVAVLLAYPQNQELQRLYTQARKRRSFAALETLRRKIAARQADLSEAKAYRLAGFADEVIEERIVTPAGLCRALQDAHDG